jgi:hypothetical protein
MQQNATIPATANRPSTTTPAPTPIATGETPLTATPGVAEDVEDSACDLEEDEEDVVAEEGTEDA